MLGCKRITILSSLFFYIIICAMYCEDDLYSETIVSKKIKLPLNILFVVSYFPSSSQIFILNIITGLIDKGHNVSIFSFYL